MNVRDLLTKIILATYLVFSAPVVADEIDNLRDEVERLRNRLAPTFEGINAGAVQGKMWVSGGLFVDAIRSIHPMTVSATQSRVASGPSSGGVASPGANIIPIAAAEAAGCRVTAAITREALRGTLETQSPTAIWRGTAAGDKPPLEVTMPIKLNLLATVVVFLSGPGCADLGMDQAFGLMSSENLKLGISGFLDKAKLAKYQGEFLDESGVTVQATLIGVPFMSKMTLKLSPEWKVLVRGDLPKAFSSGGAFEVDAADQTITASYKADVEVSEVRVASDGMEFLYQFSIEWLP